MHDAAASVWVDLGGSGHNLSVNLTNDIYWTDNGLRVKHGGTIPAYLSTGLSYGEYRTIECVFLKASPHDGSGAVFAAGPSTVRKGIIFGPSSIDIGINQNGTGALDVSVDGLQDRIITVSSTYDEYIDGVSGSGMHALDAYLCGNSVGQKQAWVNTGTSNDIAIGSRGVWSGTNGYVYCVRLYSRPLSPAEIAANYAVDKARFNLS